MWITDLQVALNELFETYGMLCCVERIHGNIITMTNRDKWAIDSAGHIKRVEEN